MKKSAIFEIVFQQTKEGKSKTLRITIGNLVALAIISGLIFLFFLIKK